MMRPAPQDFHLDKRADDIASAIDGDNDELLNTREVARLLGVSILWVELGRTKGYPDPFIDKLRWQVCEAEIIQCIDRARWARKPLKPWPVPSGMIVLLTDIPIEGVVVDMLMPYVELVDRDRPGKRLRQAFQKLGVLPPPKMLAEVARDDGQPLWPNQNAVKDEMKVVLKGVDAGDVVGAAAALSRVLGSQVRRFSYRVKGKRGAASVIYAVMRSEAARYLEMNYPGYEFTDG